MGATPKEEFLVVAIGGGSFQRFTGLARGGLFDRADLGDSPCFFAMKTDASARAISKRHPGKVSRNSLALVKSRAEIKAQSLRCG
mgnify:CR=1 FL=1